MGKRTARRDGEVTVNQNARLVDQLRQFADGQLTIEALEVRPDVRPQLATAAGREVLGLWLNAYASSLALLEQFAELVVQGSSQNLADTRAVARGSSEMIDSLYRRLGQLATV